MKGKLNLIKGFQYFHLAYLGFPYMVPGALRMGYPCYISLTMFLYIIILFRCLLWPEDSIVGHRDIPVKMNGEIFLIIVPVIVSLMKSSTIKDGLTLQVGQSLGSYVLLTDPEIVYS